MNTDIDLAWAAGFIDGEGSLHIQRFRQKGRSLRYEVRLSAGQVRRAPLDKLAAMFGGNIYPKRAPNDRAAASWGWHLSGPRAARAVRALQSYFLVKGEAAQILLDMDDLMRRTNHKHGSGKVPPEVLAQREALRVLIMASNAVGPREDRPQYETRRKTPPPQLRLLATEEETA